MPTTTTCGMSRSALQPIGDLGVGHLAAQSVVPDRPRVADRRPGTAGDGGDGSRVYKCHSLPTSSSDSQWNGSTSPRIFRRQGSVLGMSALNRLTSPG